MAAHAEWFLDRGIGRIAPDSIHAVTVPGAVDAWCRLSEDHGKLGIDRLLGQAERVVASGVGGAARILEGTRAGEADDRALVLVRRT